DLVVAVHLALHAELPQVLDEVVDERVVVVDHEYAHGPHPVERAYGLVTWTSSKGSSGSAAGKTQYQSRATAPAMSSADPMILPGSPNGSRRQIHPYIPRPPLLAQGHSACRDARPPLDRAGNRR